MECDVAIVFHDQTPMPTVLWVLDILKAKAPELLVEISHIPCTVLHLTASHNDLVRGAETMGLRKDRHCDFQKFRKNWFPKKAANFVHAYNSPNTDPLTSQERQAIICHTLDNVRARSGERVGNVNFLEGQAIFPELLAKGVVAQIFPLHEPRALAHFAKTWMYGFLEKQPLDQICEYFGVKVAVYFAWLGFYTSAMFYPAFFGLLLWLCTTSDQTSQDISCVAFSLFNVVWATLFLEGWKRHSAELSHRWGTLDSLPGLLEEPRPQFCGRRRISPITGLEEFYYPPWRRRMFRYLVSIPLCLLSLSAVFLAMFACFELQEYVKAIDGVTPLMQFLPKLLLALVVSLLDEVYKRIAFWLNHLENYRLQKAYEKQLIIKLVSFQFVNSFSSLFYIAFYLGDMQRLKEQLAAFSLVTEATRKVKTALLPHLLLKLHLLINFLRGYNLLLVGMPWITVRQLKPALHALGSAALAALRCRPANPLPILPTPAAPPHTYCNHETEPGGCSEVSQGADGIGRAVPCVNMLSHDDNINDDNDDNKINGSTSDVSTQSEIKIGTAQIVNWTRSKGAVPLSRDDLGEGTAAGEQLTAVAELMGEKERMEEIQLIRTVEIDQEVKLLAEMELHGKAPPVSQVVIESCMKKYEDTFQDYLEMFIQFGYVTLFSSTFPLTALFAFLNNLAEIRTDAFKLCTALQRPFGQRVKNIGMWQNIMEAMGVIAIVVNCALISKGGHLERLFPWLPVNTSLLLVVALEHFALLIKYVIHMAIPDIPYWVLERMAQLEFQRREALKHQEMQEMVDQEHQDGDPLKEHTSQEALVKRRAEAHGKHTT
ncbi:anoctamin-8-like [Lampetra fluviatilis]